MPIIAKEKLTKAIMRGYGWASLTQVLDVSEGEVAKGLKAFWGTGSLVEVRRVLGAPEPLFSTGYKFQGFRPGPAKETTV